MISRGLVLVDTGPLVAMRDEDEVHHEACIEALKELPRPLLTCWPVLTEAAYLLRKFPRAVEQLLGSAESGEFLRILPLTPQDIPAINRILHQYADQHLQLADACLMHLANREQVSTVFTLDRRDFEVYRPESGRGFSIVPSADG